MSGLTYEEALIVCSDLELDYDIKNQNEERWTDIYEERYEAWDEEGGFLDESSFADVAIVGGAVIACATLTFGWCLLGIFAGGAGVVGSEMDRQGDIDDAKMELDEAGMHLDRARREEDDAWIKLHECWWHHILHGPDD